MVYFVFCFVLFCSYFEVLEFVECWVLYSYFDQYIVVDEEFGYFVFDEGDYCVLLVYLVVCVVYMIYGLMLDEF